MAWRCSAKSFVGAIHELPLQRIALPIDKPFVPGNVASITSGRIESAYKKGVEPYLSGYMGRVFGDMCRDYLLFRCENLPIDIGDIGQWWGNDPVEKRQVQIDIVITSTDGKSAIFGECRSGGKDMGALSLDLKYEIAGYGHKVLSISYQGYAHFEQASNPVNVYHTQNITMGEVDTIHLKDIFTINDFFVERFKKGMYSPSREDLDLEKYGVNLKKEIERQYSNQDLINLFQNAEANYRLTEYGHLHFITDLLPDSSKCFVLVHLPKSIGKNDIKVWGHGAENGTAQIASGQEASWKTEHLPANKFLEARMLFPANLILSGGIKSASQ